MQRPLKVSDAPRTVAKPNKCRTSGLMQNRGEFDVFLGLDYPGVTPDTGFRVKPNGTFELNADDTAGEIFAVCNPGEESVLVVYENTEGEPGSA